MNEANEIQPQTSPEVACCDEHDTPVDNSLLRELYSQADVVEGVVQVGEHYLFGKLDAVSELNKDMELLADSMKGDILDYFEDVKRLLRAVYAIKNAGKSDGLNF